MQHLKDMCNWWLKLETNSAGKIVQPVTLEQFRQILPVEAQKWVCRHWTVDLKEEIQLDENLLEAELECQKTVAGLKGQAYQTINLKQGKAGIACDL